MNKYKCDGHKSVEAVSMNQATRLFAERKARKLYGKSAEVGALKQDGYCPDGSYANYQAFVGRPNRRERNISGGNIHFSVSAA